MEVQLDKVTAYMKRIVNFSANTRKLGAHKLSINANVIVRKKLLAEYWTAYEEAHFTLLGLSTVTKGDSLEYFTNDTYEEAEKSYQEAVSELEELTVNNSPGLSHESSPRVNALSETSRATQNTCRIRPIEPPSFDGDVTKWTAFRDLFTSLITNNQTLSNVQRMHYLKEACHGEAEELIHDLAVTAANFAIAWAILKKRFENSRVIITKLVEKMLALPAMGSNVAGDLKQLLNGTNHALRSLNALERETDAWDDILVVHTVNKLDVNTRKEWERHISKNTDMPTYEELNDFLEAELRSLEAMQGVITGSKFTVQGKKAVVRTHFVETKIACVMCKGDHGLFACEQFLCLSVADRRNLIAREKFCFNCISSNNHISKACRSKYSCRVCHRKHHSLLHDNETNSSDGVQATANSGATNRNRPFVTSHVVKQLQFNVLLATALIKIKAPGGVVYARALIDPASHVSIVTESVAQQLRLARSFTNVNVLGVGDASAGKCNGYVAFEVTGRSNEVGVNITALVLRRVTSDLPSMPATTKSWPHTQGLELADISFGEPGPIDVLLGADVYQSLLLDGVRKGEHGPVAQNTIFGWVLTGRATVDSTPVYTVLSMHVGLDVQLRQFWELEEAGVERTLSAEDAACEQHFINTIKREADGRYTLQFPFKTTERELGESRSMAVRRLLQVERRYESKPDLFNQYKQFMNEYLTLEHMEKVDPCSSPCSTTRVYLPHHAIHKPTSTTTKLRVVFDASHATSTGHSLNDALITGPRIQDDLSAILMRWRKFNVALSADVQKMYRQFWIAPEHRDYQRIVWRNAPTEPIGDFRLKTITYGTSSAPYMAVRAMQQAADDESARYPRAAKIIKRDFYMDDVLTGADTAAEAIQLKDELIACLQSAGLPLLKWSSNSGVVLNTIPEEHRECCAALDINKADDTIKTLGVHWYPVTDQFGFKVVVADSQLWLLRAGWDDELPIKESAKWRKFREQLPCIEEIRIDRWMGMSHGDQLEIHGFSDASKDAYAACIYVRVRSTDGTVRASLVAAKSKVAPVKQTSIPRLELCGAVLLCRLLGAVQKSLQLSETRMIAWTDSTVVLSWLQGHVNRWPTFVANRVSVIQEAMRVDQWRHVPGIENPADVASRGVMPAALAAHELWWHGPGWLQKDERQWPTQNVSPVDRELLEEKQQVQTCAATTQLPLWDLVKRYSSLERLLRITSICMRVFRRSNYGSVVLQTELHNALQYWIRSEQQAAFSEELMVITKKEQIKKGPLAKLNAFIDEAGLLRVGGRLQNFHGTYDEKHPYILPGRSDFTKLVVADAHYKVMHFGPKQTIGQLQQRLWILGVINAVRALIRRCVICYRTKPITQHQLMGNLPAERVTPSRAFLHTAIDYAGPVWTRTSKGRGHRANKAWISVFICLASTAIHLELVSDLSTDGFIAAFRRFTARRGHCSNIYCDNGTNFVGAAGELGRLLQSCVKDDAWHREISKDGTQFSFSPPGSPHFNGLAESAVKLAKTALRKIVGEHKLTFEEMCTFLSQVEAVLNSRPIGALTRDPEDVSALTPGHFLIGPPITAVPEPNLLNGNDNYATRWRLVQRLVQQFWRRWNTEYVHTMQQREKWQATRRPVEIGDVVLLRDELLPATKWKLGRIQTLHPGADGIVRVVTVKTSTSMLKRSIVKICILPIIDNIQNDMLEN